MRRALVLTLLHTSPRHVDVFERLFVRLREQEAGQDLPEIRLSHVVREALLQRAINAGVLPEDTFERATRILHEATAASDAVLCTCSTLGPAADEAAQRTSKPVLRVDRPMAADAVTSGKSIAVLATLKCTLKPTCDLLADEARAAGVTPEVAPVLVEGAWEAFEAGDPNRMNTLIAEAARVSEEAGADTIILAQASMVAALDDAGIRVPVLTSPAGGLAAAVKALRS